MIDKSEPAIMCDPVVLFTERWIGGDHPDAVEFVDVHGLRDSPNMLVAVLRNDLKFRWQAGESILSEWYLERFPELLQSPDYAIDLVFGEYLQRRRLGELVESDFFAARFPLLAVEVHRQIEFHELLGNWTAADESNGMTDCCVGDDTEKTMAVAARASPSDFQFEPQHPFGSKVPEIPPYQIGSEIGRGGMAVVYRATDQSLGRMVAIKFLTCSALSSDEQLQRFRVEAQAAARLQHPNVVQIFQFGEADGQPFLVLELVDGVTLAAFSGQPQPARESAEFVVKLAHAVDFAHDHGVVHRDLKPANVLLRPSSMKSSRPGDRTGQNRLISGMEPVITDFGLAKIVSDDPQHLLRDLTRTGELLGTPSYMAPEQVDPTLGAIGPTTDIHSLGSILYGLLTGRPPFLSATPISTLRQVVANAPVAPSRLTAGIPRDLQTICLKCLEKEPRNRYATAQSLADDLERFLGGHPIVARPVGVVEAGLRWCRRNRTVALLMGLLLTVSLSAAVLTTSLSNRADRLDLESQENYAQAKQNLSLVLDAVDRFCLVVSDDQRLNRPEFNELRQQLLHMAVEFNQQYVNMPDLSDDAKLQTARAWTRLGSLGDGSEPLADSENFLKRAREILLQLYNSDPQEHEIGIELTHCERELGRVLMQMTEMGDAEGYLQSALERADRLISVPGLESTALFEKACSLERLGRLKFMNQQEELAEPLFLESVSILESLHDSFPENTTYEIELAKKYGALGQFYVSWIQNWKRAELPYQSAAKLYEAASNRDPDSPDLRAGYATVLMLQAKWNYMALEKAKAVDLLIRSRDILVELVRDHETVIGYRTQLSTVLADLVDCLFFIDNSDPRIRASLELGESILTALIERDPDDANIRLKLTRIYLIQTDLLATYDQIAEALAKTELAKLMLEPIRASGSHKRVATERLYSIAVRRAELTTELGQFEAAMSEWDTAMELSTGSFKSFVQMQRTRTQVLSGDIGGATAEAESILSRLDSDASGRQHYYTMAARVFALATEQAAGEREDSAIFSLGESYARRAIDLLEKSATITPHGSGFIESCQDFDVLRDHPDFANILEKARSR